MTLLALDAAGHPTPLAAKQAGYRAIVQYLSGRYAMPATYPAACTNTGIPLVSAWELATNAALGGFNAGLADGTAAVAAAEVFFQPKGSAIYAAIDFGPETSQMATVASYARGFASRVRAAGYLAGIYGSNAVCAVCTVDVDRLWETLAWHTGLEQPPIALYQNGSQVTVAGTACDVDEVLRTPGAWDLRGPVALFDPPDPPEDNEMKAGIHTDPTGGQWIVWLSNEGLRRAHVPAPMDLVALKAMGAVSVQFNPATFGAILVSDFPV